MRIGVTCALALLGPWAAAGQTRRLDPTNLVVLGEGLAAGMGDTGLHEVWQRGSFGAVMARAFGSAFPQPLIQAPGIGSVAGWPARPAIVPGRWQTSVRSGSPSLFVFNLSVPGLRLNDAISRAPRAPLVQPDDPVQTSINLILGFPALAFGPGKPLWSQLDYAVAMKPTLAVVALGYTEACEAAAVGDPARLPAAQPFRSGYDRVLDSLAATFTELIVLTIPNPFDTAYFQRQPDGSFLAAPALAYTASGEPVPAGMALPATVVSTFSANLGALNQGIVGAAQARNATVVDLRALMARWREQGLTAGTQRLTADYHGGIYNFSGFYPGLTAHAAIANEILGAVNRTYGSSYTLADLAAVVRTDPAARYRPTTVAEAIR